MRVDDIIERFRQIKVPEAIYFYPNESILFNAMVHQYQDMHQLFLNNFNEARKLFDNALDKVKQKYPDMDREEIAYCICLRNCDIKDYDALKWGINTTDLKNLIILKNKYNNLLVNNAFKSVMEYRIRDLFKRFKKDIENTYNIKKMQVNSYKYDFSTSIEDDKKKNVFTYDIHIKKDNLNLKNTQNKLQFSNRDDVFNMENIYTISVKYAKDEVIISINEAFYKSLQKKKDKENNIIFDIT